MSKIIKEQKLTQGDLYLISHDNSFHKSIYLETTWGTKKGSYGIHLSVVGENIIQIDPGQRNGVVLHLVYKEGTEGPEVHILNKNQSEITYSDLGGTE